VAEVVCAGILVADVFANPIERLPAAGEVATTPGFVPSVGGCAANTAAALRILGRAVTVAGKVGEDILGDFVISELRRMGIGVQHVRRTSNHATSGTMIFSVLGEDRRYLHSIGANADFTLDDIDFTLLNHAQILYLGGYLAMPSFTPEHLTRLFREAKRRGVITVLDVVMPNEGIFGIEHVAPALLHTDYFLPNTEEARRLTGYADERRQAEALSALNRKCTVVITLGRRGSMAIQGGGVIKTPPFPMKTIDESGAGDAFTAGLITGLLNGWELESTLTFASAVGASRTRALGCSTGVFTFEEAVAFLDKPMTVSAASASY
jgi:sugar/nucleoside kinase (ribokinase family)